MQAPHLPTVHLHLAIHAKKIENTENTIKMYGFRKSNTENTENTIKIKVSAVYVNDMWLNYVHAWPLRCKAVFS